MLAALTPQARTRHIKVSVLVRSGASDGAAFARNLGAQLVEMDLAHGTEEELAAIFRQYDAVLSCVGFASGPGTQLRLTRAVLLAEVRRYFPLAIWRRLRRYWGRE